MVAAADGSDSKGKIGAGFCTLDMGRPGETCEEVTGDKPEVIVHSHCHLSSVTSCSNRDHRSVAVTDNDLCWYTIL